MEGVISSDPDHAVDYHGLSPLGVEQAEAAARNFFEIVLGLETRTPVEIYTSDFKRARDTAAIIGGRLKVGLKIKDHEHPYVAEGNEVVFKIEERLRERNFGDLEASSNENYQKVWDGDAIDPKHTKFNVESVASVHKRTSAIVKELEAAANDNKDHKETIVLLVAHGDTLQILQTYFANLPCEIHRSLEHLNTAELREMVPGKVGIPNEEGEEGEEEEDEEEPEAGKNGEGEDNAAEEDSKLSYIIGILRLSSPPDVEL